MRTGIADAPLHTGRAPAWLFERMRALAQAMGLAIVAEEGPAGLLRRLSDPFWFQAFGCVLGFDWHSSGLTTTTCGALKEGLRGLEHETGLWIAGGKGKTSRRTPLAHDGNLRLGSARVRRRRSDGVGAEPRRSGGGANRDASAALAREAPDKISTELEKLRHLELPRHHEVRVSDIDPRRMERILLNAYERQPGDFTELLAVPGVGAKGLRALSLVAELTYGEPASVRDPVTFSFAHGGKDGTPYPVDRATYDGTIDVLRSALDDAKLGRTDKRDALKRLARLERSAPPTSEC